MNDAKPKSWPEFPPGFWRRIRVTSEPGMLDAELEDDVHRFAIQIGHDGSLIKNVSAQTLRIPYTTCSGAAGFIEDQLVGKEISEVAKSDPKPHCTHMIDLASVATHFAGRQGTHILDMKVADRIDKRTTATAEYNDREVLRWQLDGIDIAGPVEWRDRDLRKLRHWRSELSPDMGLYAFVLRGAVLVSGVRNLPGDYATPPGGIITSRAGACYTHQRDQQKHAQPIGKPRKDFSTGEQTPLD